MSAIAIDDVVRLLEDAYHGWHPIGHVAEFRGPMVRVFMDKGGEEWFRLDELEVVDLSKWEAVTDGRTPA